MAHETTQPSGAPQPGARPPSETVAQPAVPSVPAATQLTVTTPAQFELGKQFAEGGMGVLYRARDLTFGRTVAVKVMKAGARPDEFVREAQVTARLPHPGIPPVYALGTLPDGRPFLAMKFVNGRTLDEVLKGRTDLAADRGRLLGAFERVCETVGFAHQRQVVHRDLKPANLMLGDAGEVFVMDWGLATPSAAPASASASAPVEMSAVVAQSVAKGVKGTPAYMAPEQARNESVDARADVFALGGILCAILTGQATFAGNSVHDVLIRAGLGDVSDAFARLDACDADAELVALAKWCLAPNRDARPANGSEVAAAVAAYRAGIEARVRRAETERAAAEARAEEEANTRAEAEARAAAERKSIQAERARLLAESKRRRTRLLLVGTVAVVLVAAASAAAGFAWWSGERKAAEAKLEGERDAEARNKAEQTRKGINESVQLATELKKKYQFKQADAALARAEQLATTGAADRTAEIKLARRDLALAVKLDDIRYRGWMEGNDRESDARKADKYRLAFKESGIDPLTGSVAELARRIDTSFARVEVIAAVDNWAFYAPAGTARDRLLEVARKADPDVWRDRLRDPNVRDNARALTELNAVVKHLHQPPAAMSDLARLLARQGKLPTGLVWTAHHARPDEYELSLACGLLFDGLNPYIALGGYEAALALRPTNPYVWTNLGGVYRSIALRSETEDRSFFNERAVAAFLRAIDLAPELANPHSSAGVVFLDLGDLQLALGHCRRAVELEPTDPQFRVNYGATLRRAGDIDGAIEQASEAIKLRPRYANAHHNLGIALRAKPDLESAARAFKNAVALNPESTKSHRAYGETCLSLQRPEETRNSALAALKVNPTEAESHHLLGRALRALGDEPGALKAFAEANKLNPKFAPNGPPSDKKP